MVVDRLFYLSRGDIQDKRPFGWRVGELAGWIQTFKESDSQLLVNKAQFLERESTPEYWTQLVKDQYRQESSAMNLKRGIAIRKENLKQYNYYSKLMTDELKDLEQVNRPPSPSEEAKKRRRYNTRSAAAASPSPSPSSSTYSTTVASSSASSLSVDIHQPINPFLVVKDTDQSNTSASMSTGTHTPKSAKVSFKDDVIEIDADSDSSYEPSSELSSQGSSPRRPSRRWIYLYPQGQGQLHYPSDFQRPWMMGKHNVAGILWSLRELIVNGLPDADTLKDNRSIMELKRPHEFLALDHIYLVQRDDVSSSLFVALGDELWRDLQAPSLDNLMDARTIEGLFDVAVRLSTLCYQDGRKLVRRWDGDDAVGEVLSALTKTSALWDANRAQDNEATDTKKRNDPFVEAYCTHLPNTHAHWDTVFPPSEARRSSASSSRGTRPDYLIGF
ncbi:MAG: hypothetical protein J3R72DRAFT_101306 [Linnemannia gamsii]|nr:MAG: hypothetical protein J3R72DRAFT_101306 [Linnemannia gamsii]